MKPLHIQEVMRKLRPSVEEFINHSSNVAAIFTDGLVTIRGESRHRLLSPLR